MKTSIKRAALAGLLVAMAATPTTNNHVFASEGAHAADDQDAADILFEVLRNDSPVGLHKVTLNQVGNETRVDIEFDIKINFLIFEAYSYEYRSSASWQDDTLLSLDATTNDDGEETRVTATWDQDGHSIVGPDGETLSEGPLFPTNHWNAAVLEQSRVLNTITGNVDDVSINLVGRETIETEIGSRDVNRYAYSGDLQTEVLYDDNGRWVGMAFEAKDGSAITYRCLRCQGGPALAAKP